MTRFLVGAQGVLATLLWYASGTAMATGLSPEAQLGKQLFFDTRLSAPAGQSCASCHQPDSGFADPDSLLPVSEGVTRGRFTARNAPSVAYAGFSPAFHFDEEEGLYVGGQFHDGRAATLEEQLAGPLLSPVEMGNRDRAAVVRRVLASGYASQLKQLYGDVVLSDESQAFTAIASAISAYERSAEVNPFSSKYDRYLAGEVELTSQERRGLRIFEDENKGNCAACHPSAAGENREPPLFTDYSYDNLGIPPNRHNPFLRQASEFNPDGEGYVDRGLAVPTGDSEQAGKFKVPTLRNVALTAPYMHNGVFETLDEVVAFYNSRDVEERWAAPEVADNVNRDELGDLGLTEEEMADLVAFLHTLTDGYAANGVAME